MPLSVHPDASSAVVLCIDDRQPILECERAFLESFWIHGSDGVERRQTLLSHIFQYSS
jgi:hypothetical protein